MQEILSPQKELKANKVMEGCFVFNSLRVGLHLWMNQIS